MTKQLVEKYRPKKLGDYVFKDEHMKNKVISYIKDSHVEGKIPFPNLLLGGVPGTGKTSLAYLLCNECNVGKTDIMYINASRENNIETVRSKINSFCSTMPYGSYKVVILDEFDRMSMAGQDALKSMFEVYGSSVRFIATANNPEKISEALISRFQVFNFHAIDENTFLDRLAIILTEENISFDITNLDKLVTQSYPDLRKAINLIDQFTIDGELKDVVKEEVEHNEKLFEKLLVEAKNKNYINVRDISSTFRIDELEAFFVWSYKNINIIINNEEYYGDAFKIVSDYLKFLVLSGNRPANIEIHVAAFVSELSRLNDE